MKLIENKTTAVRDFGKGLSLQILLDRENGARNLDVGIVDIEPGCATGMHVRDFEEVIVMLAGQGQIVAAGGEVATLNKNDCVLIPAGTVHKHVNCTDKPLKQLYIFAPQAPEDIQKQFRSLPIYKTILVRDSKSSSRNDRKDKTKKVKIKKEKDKKNKKPDRRDKKKR